MMKRSLGQKNFAIFGTFGRYVTNLRGTFVENVKKVQNQPTLMCIVQGPVGNRVWTGFLFNEANGQLITVMCNLFIGMQYSTLRYTNTSSITLNCNFKLYPFI
jgi:hypothetical protein